VPPTAPSRPQHEFVDFERPPVAEVMLAAQFPAETIDLEVYGRFANHIRDELPRRTRQGIVPRNEEKFDQLDQRPTQALFDIRLEGPAELPRVLFESEDGREVVQLQPHRMTLNWRQTTPEAQYPRYKALRPRFGKLLKFLLASLDEVGQQYSVELAEVTYINPIEYPGDDAMDAIGRTHPDLASIINRFNKRPDSAFLPEAEDAHVAARWRIPGTDGTPIGRLHLSIDPGLRPSQPRSPAPTPDELQPLELTPIYLVKLTARVSPSKHSVASVTKALDVGHEWVVRGFQDLTTPEMHHYWRLRKGGD
jgi:uncharacterized protein (TIGR04255 family)